MEYNVVECGHISVSLTQLSTYCIIFGQQRASLHNHDAIQHSVVDYAILSVTIQSVLFFCKPSDISCELT